MSTYLYGQTVDRQAAQRPRVPPGVRPLPLLRPHREGGGGPFRDRRKKRLLLHGVAGAQGVHPSRPEIPPPDRVPRGGGASCPPARSGARADSRGEPPGGGRTRRGGTPPGPVDGRGGGDLRPARKGGQHGRSPHLRRGLRSRPVAGDRRGRGNRGRRRRRGGHGQEDPPPERRNPSRARQPRLCPPRRAERVPVLPDRGESRRRFPETVERRSRLARSRDPYAGRLSLRCGYRARLRPLPVSRAAESRRLLRDGRPPAGAARAGPPPPGRGTRGGGGRRKPVRPVRDRQGGEGAGGGGGG